MRAVVCLPTRNERESIETMIRHVRALKLPLFVCDEHSTDGTIERARALRVPVYQRKCSGKGCGVQTAIEIAAQKGYDVLILIDCDCTYPVDRIPSLLRLMRTNDMVVGARDFTNIPAINRVGNVIHTLVINILYGARLRDINSGLRAIRVKKFRGLLDARSFDIEAQLTVRALKGGMSVRELPIRYKQRRGESKLRLRDGLTILLRIVRERFF